MIGLEEGCCPTPDRVRLGGALEEERRLAFVGITRAMKKLHITSAMYRTVRGISERTIPSRFLEELGDEHVLRSDRTDPFGDDFVEEGADPPGPEDDVFTPIKRRTPGAPAAGGQPQRRAADAALGKRLRERFSAGTRVRHPQFGPGLILEISGGSYARARVRFDDLGAKTLVLEYARLEVLR
jgi:DNA helicase-2/ATP-dependent DNA helicase PcrA